MWPLILIPLALGGYWYWKKKSGTTIPALSPYHAAISNLPPQNTAVYTSSTSPVQQTSNGPSTPGQIGPTATIPPPPVTTHAFDPSATYSHVDIMAAPAVYGPPAPPASGGFVNTVQDSKGGTWSYDNGQVLHDPTTGIWITSGVIFHVTNPGGSTLKMGPGWLINIDTNEIRY